MKENVCLQALSSTDSVYEDKKGRMDKLEPVN